MAYSKLKDIGDIISVVKLTRRAYSSELRASRHRATRERILTTAAVITREAGIQTLRFETVAMAAGVGLRTVFRHFPTRQALVQAVIDAHRAATPSPEASFSAFLNALCAHWDTLPGFENRTTLPDETFAEICERLQIRTTDRSTPAVAILLSPASWHLLRRQHALSYEQARACLAWTLRQVVGEFPDTAPSQAAKVAEEDEFFD